MLSSDCHRWGIRFKMLVQFFFHSPTVYKQQRKISSPGLITEHLVLFFKTTKSLWTWLWGLGVCCAGMLSSALRRSIRLLHEVITSWENYKYEQCCQGEEQTLGTDGELEAETKWSEKDSVCSLYKWENRGPDRWKDWLRPLRQVIVSHLDLYLPPSRPRLFHLVSFCKFVFSDSLVGFKIQ